MEEYSLIKFLKPVNHPNQVSVNRKLRVSLIPLQTLVQAYQSHRSQLDWFGEVIKGTRYTSFMYMVFKVFY